jgi:hypothetical protein
LDEAEIENLSVHVVWSSQIGAKAKHVAGGGRLMEDERAFHYWDPKRRIGAAFQQHIAHMSSPAWDVWMLFAPGVLWEGESPPAPTWWEHQLSGLKGLEDLRLDPERFAQKAAEISRGND